MEERKPWIKATPTFLKITGSWEGKPCPLNSKKHQVYTIFGQSHSEAMGVVIDGLPLEKSSTKTAFGSSWHVGHQDEPLVHVEKRSRSPQNRIGCIHGEDLRRPLTAIIENTNTRSKDYEKTKDIPRPSHADYPAHIRYNGFEDYRGGGHFSGRLTAPLCFAGALCKDILAKRGILSAVTLLPSAAFKISPLTPFPSPERNWNFLQKWNSPSTIPMSVIP